MKIAEVTRSYFPSVGGLENFVNSRVKLYLDLGYKVDILTTNYSTKQSFSKKKQITNVVTFKQYSIYNVCPKIFTLFFKKYDILSVNQIGNFLSDFVILFLKGYVILTPHYIFHTDKYGLLKKIHKKLLLPILLKKSRKIICFTKIERDFWINNFHLDRNKIFIIPHYFKFENSRINIIDNNYFVYLGRGSSNKEVNISIKAFNNIFDSEMKYFLTVEKEELSEECKRIVELNQNIVLLGTITEEKKNELLANMSALIFPSNFEAFGIVSFEASSFKKPLLCSDLPIFKEILDPKGVIFFNNSVEGIEKSFKTFMSMPKSEHSKMGLNNYNNLSKYSYEKILLKYQSLLSESNS